MTENLILDKKKLINTLINNTPIAYIIMDDTNRIHFVNESFLKLRGLELENTVGELCYNISNGGKHCQYCAISQAMELGQAAKIQRKDVLPNGSVRYVDDYAIPVYYDKSTGRTYLLEIMVNRSEELQHIERYNKDIENLVQSLILILEAKDTYTAQHSYNVQKYASKIARVLKMTDEEVLHISLAALLHDIGKLYIPLEILNKPAKLTDDEYEVIKSHPVKAYEMLSGLVNLSDILYMIRHHHERIDGRGYPDRIDGNELDIGSRILAVADTYDSMTTNRSYRKSCSHEDACDEIKRVSGSQLDEKIVDAFISISEESLKGDLEISDKSNLIVRNLKEQSVSDVNMESIIELEDIENNVNSDMLLDIIFNNTPCGYVLLDEKNIVKYADETILSLFGFEQDDFVDSECNIFKLVEGDCHRSDSVRMRRSLPAGHLVFDVYETIVMDQGTKYYMYVVLDRTEEAAMRESVQKDYLRMIEILEEMLQDESNSYDMDVLEKLAEIKERAELS